MVKPRVYVGGLPHDVSERDLEKFFKGFGRLREVLIKNGYGFVEFDDQRDADDAVYELDGEKLLGQRVTVQKARGIPRGRDRDQRDMRGGGGGGGGGRNNSYRGTGRNDRFGPPTRTKHRVIVENLSSRVSWQDLKDFMRKAGEVTYADAHKEHQNEGVVEFSSYAEMKNAIKKLDDTELNGRRIRIVEDYDSNKGRSASRSRSRSRSYRSRSRSNSRARKAASRSKSRSPAGARKSGSRSPVQKSKSRSPVRKSRSRSSVRMSRSRSPVRKSRSRSPVGKSASRDDYSRSRSRSPHHSSRRSKSREESKPRSRPNRSKSRSRSRSN